MLRVGIGDARRPLYHVDGVDCEGVCHRRLVEKDAHVLLFGWQGLPPE